MCNESQKSAVSKLSKTDSDSGVKKKCYQLLFSCFKDSHKKRSKENVDYEPKECDYIVEKLIVKRVPFIFFTIPEDTLETKIDDCSKDTKEPLTSVSKTQSLSYYTDRLNRNKSTEIPNKYLHSDANMTAFHEENKSTLSTNYDTRITKLRNTTSSMHPSLKECKRSWKDTYMDKLQGSDQSNKTFVAQPVQDMFYNFTKFRQKIMDSNRLNVEDYNLKYMDIKSQSNDRLLHNQKIAAYESKLLAKNILNTNQSNRKLRWKIIVKHYKPETLHYSKGSREADNYFNTN
ncbi:uncharacterized protein LOC122400507 [Colletes gigas]|uniref:uncharacterized protein LOC122400507 n=1 Tax=Colletes gigas TaxID=935657 RepID=UPI001C9BA653|nr:uncharacterized protein LOC122400507 [Colletes gigas]